MPVTLLAVAGMFTTSHIAVTAAITGVVALVAAFFVVGRRDSLAESLAIGVLAGAVVFLWRKSANMPQLNTDGLTGFSANDWLAPTITFVVLKLVRGGASAAKGAPVRRGLRFGGAGAFVVNVATI